ncbi:MAG: hypothetical protein AB7O29_12215 [Acidimicrobiia bacterium]
MTAPPAQHAAPLAGTPDGRQDNPAGLRPSPATDATQRHRTPPCAPLLDCGDLVRWRTSRASGYGEALEITAGHVLVRPFLPARSHTVRCATSNVTRLAALSDLLALLERS